MTSHSRERLLYGTHHAPPPPRRLVAGQLSAALERGNLRDIRFGEVEIVRAISFLVRSPRWATYDAEINDLVVNETESGFDVTYRATVREGQATLDYRGVIKGRTDGSLAFRCDVIAQTDFETSRTGFVVLHPASVAGRGVRIEHADGSVVSQEFPKLINPYQPMLDLRALTHEAAPGITVTCRMEGDVFEMEDQRNWTDASFKTYVRPLSRPWPYTIPAGSHSTQSVVLSVQQDGHADATPRGSQPIRVEAGAALGIMPLIGLGCTPEEARQALPHAAVLAGAGIAVLVCRYDTGQGHTASDLRSFSDLARVCAAEVELQIVVQSVAGFAGELHAVARAVREADVDVRALAVSPAPDLKSVTPGQSWPECAPLAELYEVARAAFPGIPLFGGTFAYFTELNRKRPPIDLLDGVTFSTSPLVHAADDRSVMESLEALPAVIASVRHIAGGKPFVVGPSAIGMRDNPYGPAPLANPDGARLAMSGADPRQRGLFNAAWTLGYIARFAAGGASRIAVSGPAGPSGILDEDGVFPVFPVISGCAALRGATLHELHIARDREVLGLLAVLPDRRELWLANLTAEPLTVELPTPFQGALLHRLDLDTLATVLARRNGLELSRPEHAGSALHCDAYAVTRCVAHAAG